MANQVEDCNEKLRLMMKIEDNEAASVRVAAGRLLPPYLPDPPELAILPWNTDMKIQMIILCPEDQSSDLMALSVRGFARSSMDPYMPQGISMMEEVDKEAETEYPQIAQLPTQI